MSAESPQNDKALVVTREVDSHQFGTARFRWLLQRYRHVSGSGKTLQ